jgi:hypothetical protein
VWYQENIFDESVGIVHVAPPQFVLGFANMRSRKRIILVMSCFSKTLIDYWFDMAYLVAQMCANE